MRSNAAHRTALTPASRAHALHVRVFAVLANGVVNCRRLQMGEISVRTAPLTHCLHNSSSLSY